MNIINIIKFIGSKRPQYEWENIKNKLGAEIPLSDEDGIDEKGNKNGYWGTYYHNEDQLQSEGMYVNGLKEGTWRQYHRFGNLNERQEYKDGKKEGEYLKVWPNNGGIMTKVNYVNDKMDGDLIMCFNNGQLYRKIQFVNGVNHGEETEYYPNGNFFYKWNWVNGWKDGVFEWFFENGNIRDRVTYENGSKNGPYESYWENGNLNEKGIYVRGDKTNVENYPYHG